MDDREDIDRCVTLALSPRGKLLEICAVLPDGRRALRQATSEAEFARVVEALVALPFAPGAEEPASMEPQTSSRATQTGSDARKNGEAARQPTAVQASYAASPNLRLEVGAAISGRISGRPMYAGVGGAALAQLVVNDWLLGVSARADGLDSPVSESVPPGFSMQSYAIGVLAGRRTRWSRFLLDLAVGPEVVVENQEIDGATDNIEGSAGDLRGNVSARASLPFAWGARLYLTVDAEGSPRRAFRSKKIDPALPFLPAWSSGISMGCIWSPL